MRVALLSDIHGNSIALDAVLADVKNPFSPDLRASYAILDADGSGYRIQRRRVAYDREAVIAAVQHVRHPAADYITQYMLGQNRPPWNR